MSKKKGNRSNKKQRNNQHSSISQHRQNGKKLIPPLADIPNSKLASWRDNRLPEMLWSALLVCNLSRAEALKVFREVAEYLYDFRDTPEPPYDITLTGLSKLEPSVLTTVLEIITSTEERKGALLPLLLLTDLPASEYWTLAIGKTPSDDHWEQLFVTIWKTTDHQSQESTDCRWSRLICVMAAGKLSFPRELAETAREIQLYPDQGDMRKVRPDIRATEGALDALESIKSEWPQQFWSQCLLQTECFALESVAPEVHPRVGTTPEHIARTYDSVIKHCFQTISTTGIDAKHDTVFGSALYCISILQELLRIGASQTITSQVALRTLVECYINLAYLTKKDDPELWKSFRVFGAGQAKLQYLKLEEADANPAYVEIETLKELANEDAWEEFLSIDLGHWEKSNLRKLSIDANVKEVYDQYYSWPSSFAHSHWGSIRDTVYDTCGNPLHRFHRIPRQSARALPDVITDACILIDKILEILSNCYPEFLDRVTINA